MRSLPLVWMIFLELTKASCSFWIGMISFCVGVGMKVLWFLNLRNIMSVYIFFNLSLALEG